MPKYKAVFSDIDGTLLNTKHQIPEDTKKKIQKINKEGIPYVLVSARMPKGMTAIRDGNARRPLREGGVAHQQNEHQTCGQPADALGA